jgi:hypothetical protein
MLWERALIVPVMLASLIVVALPGRSLAGVPPAARLIGPSGTVSTTTPTYTWSAVPGVTWYYLWVNDGAATPRITQWYRSADAGCAAGTGTCSVTSTTAVTAGAATWWIQTWASGLNGPWSAAMTFTATGPPVATLIGPSGTVSTTTPTYTWSAVPGVTWYYLWVNDGAATPRITQWYRSADAGCAAGTGTCSVTSTTAVTAGAATWWIQTWASGLNGPWSAAMTFVAVPPASNAIEVSYRLDPWLVSGNYVGGLWVSPPTLGPVTQGVPTFVLETRADERDATGMVAAISAEWITSDPAMVTVSPGVGHQVTITVNGVGQSIVNVVSQGLVRTLSVNATPYLDGAILVEISQ